MDDCPGCGMAHDRPFQFEPYLELLNELHMNVRFSLDIPYHSGTFLLALTEHVAKFAESLILSGMLTRDEWERGRASIESRVRRAGEKARAEMCN